MQVLILCGFVPKRLSCSYSILVADIAEDYDFLTFIFNFSLFIVLFARENIS